MNRTEAKLWETVGNCGEGEDGGGDEMKEGVDRSLPVAKNQSRAFTHQHQFQSLFPFLFPSSPPSPTSHPRRIYTYPYLYTNTHSFNRNCLLKKMEEGGPSFLKLCVYLEDKKGFLYKPTKISLCGYGGVSLDSYCEYQPSSRYCCG